MWEEPPPPRRSLDPRDFRAALGCFPTGVCLVTARGPVGMTINSFSSVSLDPPMILWSLARTASSAPVFRDAEYFAVNVLSSSDAELSAHFARPGADRFSFFEKRFSNNPQGIPLLAGAAATFECHTRHRYYGGDHIILIGQVERYVWSKAEPLLFHGGRYAAIGAAA